MTDQRRPHRSVHAPLAGAVLAQHVLGVGVCDAQGLLMEQNDALRELLGTPHQAVRSSQWAEHFHMYTEDGTRRLGPGETPLGRALRGERVADEVIAVLKPGEPSRYVRCNGSQIFHPDGELAGAVVFVVDATESAEQRHRLDALRDRLIDTVNHELRTPATALIAHVELLEELRDQLPPDAAWSVEALSRNLARMQAVLDEISETAAAVTAHD